MSIIDKLKKIANKHGLDISKYDPKQLIMGFKVEHEHAVDPKTAVTNKAIDILKIAAAHLNELPDYYTRLVKMENENYIRETIRNTMKDME